MRSYFDTGWNDETVIVWGDDNQYQPDSDPWVRFNILHNDGLQATIGSPGNNRFDRFGVITVQIFVRQGDYGIKARELATKALKLYEGVQDNDIIYSNAFVREVGNDGRGWQQINALINFRYEEIT